MRLIDADALDIYDVSPAYGMVVMGVTINDIDDAPTVESVPVSFIESEIKRMDNQIKRAMKDDDDEWAERAIIRKLALEFTLAKWMAEREE